MEAKGWDPVGANPAEGNPYAAPAADAIEEETRSAGVDDARADFYVVSLSKFYILSTSTFGFYTLYWFFAQFRAQRRSGMRTSPAWAAIFSIFTVHRLFRRFDRAARDAGLPSSPRAINYAAPYIVLALASQLVRIFGEHNVLANVGSMALFVISNVPLARAQVIVNRIAGDELGESNARLSAANIVTVALGAIVWLLVVAGFALPAATN